MPIPVKTKICRGSDHSGLLADLSEAYETYASDEVKRRMETDGKYAGGGRGP